MPTYAYRCKTDNTYLEMWQDFANDEVPACDLCGETMSKVIFATPTHFKTGGFYRTDNQ